MLTRPPPQRQSAAACCRWLLEQSPLAGYTCMHMHWLAGTQALYLSRLTELCILCRQG